MAVKILFSGDFVPIVDEIKFGENCFSDIQSVIANADAHVTNLECPLTSYEVKIAKTGPHLKASPGAIKLLRNAGVDLACLANNHIYDYGAAGLQQTIEICEQNGLTTLGLINRPDAKKSWAIKEIKGQKIGFLNFCENEFSVREDGEFGANGYDPITCFQDIRLLRPQVDYLFVIYHGGNEYYPLPRPGLRQAFHFLVELGADAVVCHHSHVISGYEIYKGKPLVYGLGNFYFPYDGEPEEWHIGLLCSLTLDQSVQIKLIPIEQCRSKLMVTELTGQVESKIRLQVDQLSMICQNDQALQKEWRKYVGENIGQLAVQFPGVGRFERMIMKAGFPAKKILSNRAKLAALNRRRCQSHHELMISFIKEMLK